MNETTIEKFALSTIKNIPDFSNSTIFDRQKYESAIYIFMNGKCSKSQEMIVYFILKSKLIPKNLLSNAILLLHEIKKPIPLLVDTLDKICFDKLNEIRNQNETESYEDIAEIEKRSCLALGSLLSSFKKIDYNKTRKIINKFHSHLYDKRPTGKFFLYL